MGSMPENGFVHQRKLGEITKLRAISNASSLHRLRARAVALAQPAPGQLFDEAIHAVHALAAVQPQRLQNRHEVVFRRKSWRKTELPAARDSYAFLARWYNGQLCQIVVSSITRPESGVIMPTIM